MDRREFLTKVGLGSLASASLLGALATPARADDGETGFFFADLSYNTADPDGEKATVAGAGTFSVEDAEVKGGGCYNFVNTGAPGLPKPLIEFGEWKAKRLLSWTPIGTYGAHAAGILVLGVKLFPAGGKPYAATLEVVCNIPFVPLLTGEDEGVTLTTPTVTFAPGGAVGRPQTGITLFCVGSGDD